MVTRNRTAGDSLLPWTTNRDHHELVYHESITTLHTVIEGTLCQPVLVLRGLNHWFTRWYIGPATTSL
jgi:hypothetical protein